MDNKQLNKLVVNYQTSGDQSTFRVIHNETLGKRIRQAEVTARTQGVDKDDLLEVYDDTLWKVIVKYDLSQGNFANLLNNSISRNVKRLMRDTGRFKRRYQLTVDKPSDEDAATFEIAADYDLEREVIKKRTDHRQVIDSLTRNSDAITTAIVNAYLYDDDTRPTAIGRKLGIHHEVVKRKLSRLSRNYDATRFGDISDYLAV